MRDADCPAVCMCVLLHSLEHQCCSFLERLADRLVGRLAAYQLHLYLSGFGIRHSGGRPLQYMQLIFHVVEYIELTHNRIIQYNGI